MKKYFMVVLVFLLSACVTQEMKVETSFEDLEPTANGKTYYVSGTGNDNNDGLSTGKAFRTLQRAADQTQPGDTVLVLNGTYRPENPSDKKTQIFDYNLVFSGTGFDSNKANNIIGQHPKFINTSSKDFRLQSTSPAINKGSSSLYARRDFNLVARPLGKGVDMGAFEIR